MTLGPLRHRLITTNTHRFLGEFTTFKARARRGETVKIALLWAAVDEDHLGSKAARAISTTPFAQLAISDVSLQEVGLLRLAALLCRSTAHSREDSGR